MIKKIIDKFADYIIEKSSLNYSRIFESGGSLKPFLGGDKVTQPYKQNSSVYKAVKALVDNVPQADFAFYNWRDDSREWDSPEAKELIRLFARPNPQQSRAAFFGAVAGFYALYNEVFIVKVYESAEDAKTIGDVIRSGKRLPKELYTFNPSSFMRVVQDGIVTGYRNNSKPLGKEFFALPEIIHIEDFNPYHDEKPPMPTEPVDKLIAVDWLTLIYNKAFFENDATLGLALATDGKLTDTQIERMRTQIEKRHKGANKAFSLGIFEGGLKPVSVGQTHKDMDFIEQRKHCREEILGQFRSPKALFNITDDLNYATFVGQMKVFWQYGIMPILNRVSDEIDSDIVQRYAPGLYSKFDTSQVPAFQEDFYQKVDSAMKLNAIGYPINAINAMLGLGFDDVAWGDYWWIPYGQVPADAEAASAAFADYETPTENEKPKEDEKEKSVKKKNQRDTRAEWKRFQSMQEPKERIMYGAVKKFFFDQRRRMLESLYAQSQDGEKMFAINKNIDINFSFDKEDELLLKFTKDILEDTIELGINHAEKQAPAKLPSSMVEQLKRGVLAERCQKITQINRTTQRLIRSAIAESVAEGGSIADIAKSIKSVFNAATSRARVIARTETAGAMNSGSYLYYEETGTKHITWIVADGEARDSHLMADGETIEVGQKFSNGLAFPSDPNGDAGEVINCRCTIVPED